MSARIFEIKRFAVHDGDGIRTTVFFKGCPLKCVWCHNPEGIDFKPELAYYENKCINCGECIRVCPNNAHTIEKGVHIFNRKKCTGCGNCEEVCLGNALTLYGEEVTEDELLPKLLEDKEFYENSNGGVTLSGGECLMQSDFCAELLKKLKENGINTAVDTCGFVPQQAIDKVIPYTDVFLYDMKAYDEDIHIKCTGYSNKLILENIKYIDSCNKAIEVRIPYVPDYNSDQIEKIAVFLKDLNNLTKVRILPYHNYAGSKYTSLAKKNTLPTQLPTDSEMEDARTILRKYGLKVVE
ncbi:MAG: glycyl-radical enzyme activating protein [Clostridia bacterium]|nr:glycyl-radical enzyme activating protein [Clostridia bacterium]